MEIKTILYVEDEEVNALSLQDEVDEWNERNEDGNRKFRVVNASSHDSALRQLSELKIDCVLLDLRVPISEGAQESAGTGNNLAVEVPKLHGMPLAILSGYIAELGEEARHGGLVGVFDKGDISEGGGFKKAVAWLGDKWEMMQVLSLARSRIEQSTAEVFVKRLWPQWETLLSVSGHNQERLATVVSRQFMSHAAELLGLEGPENETWHPFEHYIVPPLLDSRAHTGDIFEFDDARWIVLTPQCDMATEKVSTILLAKCRTGMDEFLDHVTVLRDETAHQNVRLRSKLMLESYVNQNIEQSRHFLPPLPFEQESLVVKFGELRVILRDELKDNLGSRVASVSPPFLPNLVQRFGAFMSRTGQPNIDVNRF